MTSEIVVCKICRREYELLFGNNDECVSETSCKCVSNKVKNLDKAIIKLGEYLNEKSFSKNQRHSKKSKICS